MAKSGGANWRIDKDQPVTHIAAMAQREEAGDDAGGLLPLLSIGLQLLPARLRQPIELRPPVVV
jgi:hypothetical protein